MPACDRCEAPVSRSTDMARHQAREPCRRITALIARKVAEAVDDVNADNENLRDELDRLRRDIDRKEYMADEFKQIVKECALRPTSSSNNTHYTQNNLLQYLSPDPIPFSRLPEELAKALRPQDITAEPQTFTERVRKCLLQDDDGKSKVVCTDSARGKFAYKDEKEDQATSRPDARGAAREPCHCG